MFINGLKKDIRYSIILTHYNSAYIETVIAIYFLFRNSEFIAEIRKEEFLLNALKKGLFLNKTKVTIQNLSYEFEISDYNEIPEMHNINANGIIS